MKLLPKNIAAAVTGTLMLLTCAIALQNAFAEEQSTIRITAGETLEIASDATSADAQFSWILTKDRKFLSGQRTRFFQTRLTDPGTYTLDVSVQNPQTGENALHTFAILVTDPAEAIPPDNANNLTQLPLRVGVLTEPVSISNIVYLPPLGGLVKIDASKSEGKIEKYSIDLDTTVDGDNNGNPADDRDNAETLSEKSGSPVYFYALPKRQPRSVRIWVSDLSGGPASSVDLPLSFSSTPSLPASSVAPLQSNNGPIVITSEGLDVGVAAKMDDPSLQGKQLLLEWDFGDRSKSLLLSPSHRYASAGTYVVSLTVRDIATGEILQSVSTTVQVSEPEFLASSGSESSASSSSSKTSTASTKSSFSIMGVIQVLLIVILLLGIAVGLYALLTWIKKRTTNSIQKTLEKMEETIVSKEPAPEEGSTPAPMKLKKEVTDVEAKAPASEIVDREKSREEMNARKRPNETPVTSAGPVPPWLKNSASPAADAPKKEPAPKKPDPKPAEAAPSSVAATPEWLKPKAEAPKPAESRPSSPAATPSSAPKPASTAPSAPANTQGPVPPWLKPQSQAPQRPTVAEAPKPAPAPKPEAKPSPVSSSAPVQKPAPAPVPAPPPRTDPVAGKISPEPPAVVSEPKPAETAPKVNAGAPPPLSRPPEKAAPATSLPKAPPSQDSAPQKSSPEKDDDSPIAIIQADSLTK